jgi:hypothetical protein
MPQPFDSLCLKWISLYLHFLLSYRSPHYFELLILFSIILISTSLSPKSSLPLVSKCVFLLISLRRDDHLSRKVLPTVVRRCDLETSRMRRPWPALGRLIGKTYLHIDEFSVNAVNQKHLKLTQTYSLQWHVTHLTLSKFVWYLYLKTMKA